MRLPDWAGSSNQDMHLPWRWVYRALGAGIAIAIMEVLARLAGEPLSRVPFVTSIVLAMALPDSDAAHPRAIIGGHVLSSGCGLLCLWIAGPWRDIQRNRCGPRHLFDGCFAGRPPAGWHWRFSRSCLSTTSLLAFQPGPRWSAAVNALQRTLAARRAVPYEKRTPLISCPLWFASRSRLFERAALPGGFARSGPCQPRL